MKEAEYYLVPTTLDDIAWALNIRGAMWSTTRSASVTCSSLLKSTHWFVHEEKVPGSPAKTAAAGRTAPTSLRAMEGFLTGLGQRQPLLYDPGSTSINLFEALKRSSGRAAKPHPPHEGHQERNGGKAHPPGTMRKDGVALLKLYRWLEAELQNRTVSEYELAQQLVAFAKLRAITSGKASPPSLAMPPMAPSSTINPSRIPARTSARRASCCSTPAGSTWRALRTLPALLPSVKPTEEQRRNYTLVLKGNIALSRAVFPEGTAGVQLDILVRMHLWRKGAQLLPRHRYMGGLFPQCARTAAGFYPQPEGERGETPFQPGMLTSNEPGYYKTGEYGIRIENLELCVEQEANGNGRFFAFEPLTLFPIDLRLAELEILTPEEKEWLNDYHRKVLNELTPLLNDEEHDWLAERCRAV
ncbi:MAG: M24 family metallopeptidase C-terminal domain-containing protein [Lewinellaceae bacterium]|nr:M24 family metallopeptidase C-terminal domain-containing protein [Lewinellaceae bacterium]